MLLLPEVVDNYDHSRQASDIWNRSTIRRRPDNLKEMSGIGLQPTTNSPYCSPNVSTFTYLKPHVMAQMPNQTLEVSF